MGGASSRSDVPQAGQPHHFRIKADSMVSGDFTVYEGKDEEGASDSKRHVTWIPFTSVAHSSSTSEKEDGEKPLLVFDVSGVNFTDADVKLKEKPWWKSEDKTAKLAWEISRTVVAYEAEIGGHEVATLEVCYAGKAEVKKDVDYEDKDGDGHDETREVEWKCKVETKEIDFHLCLGGCTHEVQHTLGDVTSQHTSYEQTYTVTNPGITVSYNDNWGLDTVNVKTSADAEPLCAIGMGFLIAYWMHPRRVMDDAVNRARQEIIRRGGYF